MNELGARFRAASGVEVTLSFAGSGELAKQIENGAPASVFISADDKWMDYLADRRLIAADSRRDLLSNSLVLIAPKDSGLSIELRPGAPLKEALGDGKLAMADPDVVPGGRYGKAALESLGLWAEIEPILVRTKDPRAALALVERGEAAAGLVYATDAKVSDGARIVAEFAVDTHPPIVYPMAVVSEHDGDAARAFAAYLAGPEAKAIFERFGFIVLPLR
jgi:molybdate transport system substrate-binding protein